MPMLSSNDTAPGRQWVAITPSDATILPVTLRAIYVGGDGNLALEDHDGNVEVFTGLTAGSLLPLRPRKVMSTDTTATLVIGIY